MHQKQRITSVVYTNVWKPHKGSKMNGSQLLFVFHFFFSNFVEIHHHLAPYLRNFEVYRYPEYRMLVCINVLLMANNLQKWKSRILTCPCHKIYRIEAVGLSFSNCTFKNPIFVNIWNLGKFRENLSSNLKILLHICDTYNWDNLLHTTFRWKYRFSFPTWRFSPYNHLALLKRSNWNNFRFLR